MTTKKPLLTDDSLEAVFFRDDRWSSKKRGPRDNRASILAYEPSCAARAAYDRHILRVEIESLRAQVQALKDQYARRRDPTEAYDGGRLG